MNTTGLLFTPENYAKTERGEKTMTRRIMRSVPKWIITGSRPVPERGMFRTDQHGNLHVDDEIGVNNARALDEEGRNIQCPYGTVGDRLDAQNAGDPQQHCIVELTDVRAERVQQISYDDEGAEGITLGPDCNDRNSGFIVLWESIYGPGSWAINPWVWVLSYRTLHITAEAP